jgi:hypothetical protein
VPLELAVEVRVPLELDEFLQVDAMIRLNGVITISPSGDQPPAGLSAARGSATLRAYVVFSVTID